MQGMIESDIDNPALATYMMILSSDMFSVTSIRREGNEQPSKQIKYRVWGE
jgi:hypothetical protein